MHWPKPRQGGTPHQTPYLATMARNCAHLATVRHLTAGQMPE
jgi:hypothetical protein